jgi:GNAT superfamily N-acetyltransferase
VIVRPDHPRRGAGTALTGAALDRCGDRRLALVSNPAAVPFFAAMGIAREPHRPPAICLRLDAGPHEHDPV